MSQPILPKQPEFIKLVPDSGVQKRLPCWPSDQDEITEAVVRAISSGHWSRYSNGPNAIDGSPHHRLTEKLHQNFRSPFVRLVSSGTAAVELALRVCRLGPGDEIILSAFDYPGNLRCISMLGADPVMVDIQPRRWSIDVQQVVDAISPQTKAILASHLYQNMADISELRRIADEAGIYLIEDACQSPGAEIMTPAGTTKAAGTIGHIGTLSFGGTKLLTSGNGGAILTEDARLAQRLTVALERPSDTFPLSQLQSASLLPQIESLAYWNTKRQQGARWFTEQLAKLSSDQGANSMFFLPHLVSADSSASLYKFAFFTGTASIRDQLLTRVRVLGIPCGHGFPCFAKRAARRSREISDLAYAARAAETTVVLDHRALIADLPLREEIVGEVAKAMMA